MGRYNQVFINRVRRNIHDVVWEIANKRKVPEGYVVHHADGNHRNNSPSNLVLMTRGEHARLHAKLRAANQDVVDPNDPEVIKSRECVRQSNARHAEETKIKKAEYYQQHRDEILTKHAEYHAAHREAVNARHRATYAAHKDEMRAKRKLKAAEKKVYMTAYWLKHRDLLCAKNNLKNAIRKGAPEAVIAERRRKVEIELEKERNQNALRIG